MTIRIHCSCGARLRFPNDSMAVTVIVAFGTMIPFESDLERDLLNRPNVADVAAGLV